MPNWCSNTVSIIHPPSMTEEIIAFLADPEEKLHFSLNKIVPMPELPEDDSGQNAVIPNWYSWRVEHWGTKWDVDCAPPSLMNIDDNHNMLVYSFDSAWNSPIEAINVLAEKYSQAYLHLVYDEPGMDFSGTVVWSGGVEQWHDERGFSLMNAEMMNDPVISWENSRG